MTLHSSLGASSMYRWAACPGSVRESAKAGKKASSSYADEGTNAHALAAFCFTHHTRAVAQIGKTINWEGRKFEVTEDMADAVEVYLEHVRTNHRDDDIDLLEHKFDLSKVYPGCFGTADYVTYRISERLLIVRDYKHGAGIYVSVYENKQLQYYALGALMTCDFPVDRVRMEIIQPRCEGADGPVRSWEIDAFDLLDFAADLRAAAAATEELDAPLTPGDHCKFCAAAATCPALEQRSRDIAKLEFGPVAAAVDLNKLAAALDEMDGLKARIKAIRQFAYERAEAGDKIPRWKLVDKRGNRKYKDEDEAAGSIEMMGLAEDEMYEPRELKSPAKLEKLVAKKFKSAFDADKADSLVKKESSGRVLVPITDKRPAVLLAPSQVFEAIQAPVKTIFD